MESVVRTQPRVAKEYFHRARLALRTPSRCAILRVRGRFIGHPGVTMNMLNLDATQRQLLDAVREIAETEFAAAAHSWEGEVPWENVETLVDLGFYGINIDEQYGGGGMTEFELLLMLDEIGRVCPDTASFMVNQLLVGPRTIAMFGSEAVRERYLQPVTAGEDHVAIAISEPGAGSDVKSMGTTAEPDGDDWVVNGEKIWVTDLPAASAAVTWAKLPEGLGVFIIDLDRQGVKINHHFTNMAGGSQTHFFMNDVEIPDENVIVRERDAFKELLKALNWERLGGAALANAIALNALTLALEYAQDREQFDQPIADFQGIEWKLADAAKKLQHSRMYTLQAGKQAVEQGRVPDPLQTSIAKLYATEMAEEVVSESLQLHGATGYQQGHPMEYLYRFARGRRIAGGTTEIQKNQIAKRLKADGLPRMY